MPGASGAKMRIEAGFDSGAQRQDAESKGLPLDGLEGPAQVVRDGVGVPHIYAKTEHDAYFLVGYLHAQDRLFQMDASRRQASGTLAELLGPGALASDGQLRTIGLRRAAARSLAAISSESQKGLEAYSDGVNAWINSNPLPSEYAALELTKAKVPAWTPLDSMAVTKLLAFGLSSQIEDIARTLKLIEYQTKLGEVGGRALFFEDVMRSEPFAPAPSILSGETSGPSQTHGKPAWSSSFLDPAVSEAAEEALKNAKEAGIPVEPADQGSNIWVVSGAKSESGRPMVASDPHLSLASPPTFYETGIDIGGNPNKALSLYGVTFPGTPIIVHGTNGHVSWGSTVNPTDVSDVYQEQLTLAGTPPVPVGTTYKGNPEPTQIIPETFQANQPGNGTPDDLVVVPPAAGVPAGTVVVPRRNNGPLISVSGTTGLSLQHTAFSPTREPDFFRLLSRARTVREAIDAQRYFDFGAQNWMYVDDHGNIGYKTSGEIPLREDLQAGTVTGAPPYFIRNGTGGNEWIPENDPTPPEDQASAYEILPFGEMDGLVNPARGWIANANQDPTGQTFDNNPLNEPRPGGGIRYITPGHEDGNRNARITARIEAALADGAVTFGEMQSIQSDVKLNDAQVLVPYITAALANAQLPGAPAALATLGADPKVQEAVTKLSSWDFSTPTGIQGGYDASDVAGDASGVPTQPEIDASVAATIYSLWRGQALKLIIDDPLADKGIGTTFLPDPDQAMSGLRDLLEGPSGLAYGTGASGIVFFAGAVGRDTKILEALRKALDLAASTGPNSFAPAFGGSTNLADYRWGKLHRKVFLHPLGDPFSIPPGAGFSNLGAGLPGVATDGGYDTVDASRHNPRASTLNGFMFPSGPARRFVAEALNSHPHAVQVIPGGESGNPFGQIPGGESGNPFGGWFGNQLGLWLTDDYHGATTVRGEVLSEATLHQQFVPVFVPAP